MSKSLLEVWDKVRAACAGQYEIFADGVLVEYVPMEAPTKELTRADGTKAMLYTASGPQKTIDGIELTKAHFVRVLDIGKGYYDEETGASVPIDLSPGDVCMVLGPTSVKWWSTAFGLIQEGERKIGVMKDAEVVMRFKGQAAFDAFLAAVRDASQGAA